MATITSLDEVRDGKRAPDGFEDLPPIMSAPKLAEHLELDPKTLERWRKTWPNGDCTGPRFSKAPGTKLYRYYRRDVLTWLDEGLMEEEKPVVAATGQNINA
ncbi:hypothetical protein ICM05_01235 [Leucobacter sp. cx-42]|uniref:hypothetical protein n=1 Tax=unclassified Leucobacter TaxID=2621730 RepID=UPI00165D4D17|nr:MULTISPECIES: hypothetical protein [unclassified Leucobacter]MBC9953272.1 hypothetical protein [Leucobacter sp. cx-42]